MNDIKLSATSGWNLLLGLSIVALVVTAWVGFIHPLTEQSSSTHTNLVHQIQARTEVANKESAATVIAIQDKGWNVGPEILGAKVMDMLSSLAIQDHLQLSGFRTEKPVEVVQMQEAPFVIVAEGAFPNLLSLLNQLEDRHSKLAVNMVQISASDSGPGNVTATLGLVAFLPKEVH